MGMFNLSKNNKQEYHLENVIEQNRLFPRTFLIPSHDEINNLNIGSLVKLIFVMEKSQVNGCRAEKMWVKIQDIENDVFTGVLDNDPVIRLG